MLEVLGIKNYQKLVPIPEDMKPRDPVTENMDLLRQKPVKAFLYQDHQAHITVHMAAMQDPKIQQIVGQNPQVAQMIAGALSAHVAEHLGMEYRKQIERGMGMLLPEYKEDADEPMMSPEIEIQVSQMAAQAAQQLLQKNMAEAQQQKAQQQMQDPIIQLQQKELEIKAGDLQRKMMKDQADSQLKAAQIQLESQRQSNQQQAEGAKLIAKTMTDEAKLRHMAELEGFRGALAQSRQQSQSAQPAVAKKPQSGKKPK